jgi:hypothetical protein
MEVLEFIAKYLVLPLGTIICTMGWRMIKKQDERIDSLEKRTNNTEKNVIEIKTEIRKDIQYMAEDIKEIKQLLKSDR